MRFGIGSALESVFRTHELAIPPLAPGHALIDTGATRTVVRDDVVRQLGLNPVGSTVIATASSQHVRCYEYVARIVFPNNVVFESVMIGAPLLGQSIDCLIGRDILSHGILIYVGYTNTFTVSF